MPAFSSKSGLTPLQLTFTRGTVIPCFLVLSHNSACPTDISSLLLSASKPLFELRLQRRITHLQDASHAGAPQKNKTPSIKTTEDCIGEAVWWKPASMESAQDRDRCYLEGEIHLSSELSPSCQIGFFSVEVRRIPDKCLFLPLICLQYIVSLVAMPVEDADSATISSLPRNGRSRPSTSSTRATSSSPQVVLSCPIKIATFHVHGPLPTPYTIRPRREDRSQSSLTRKASKSDIQPGEVFSAYSLRS